MAQTYRAAAVGGAALVVVVRSAQLRWTIGLMFDHPPHLTLRVANEIRRMLVVK